MELMDLTKSLPCLHCGSIDWGIVLNDPPEENSRGSFDLIGECNNCGKMFDVELDEDKFMISLKKIKIKPQNLILRKLEIKGGLYSRS